MEKKCKVVTLVTDKAENALIVNTEGNKSMWGYKKDHLFTMEYLKNVPAKPYHLYITSDDEIKDDDWCINQNNRIIQYKQSYRDKEVCKKIIATTDKSLIPLFCKTQTKNIPQISQSFINQYIESYNKGNVITEVTVEYEEYMKQGIFNKGDDTHYFDVKINPDNTINIKLIKDNYSREEVIILLQNVIKDSYSYELEEHHGGDYRNLKKWIEENL